MQCRVMADLERHYQQEEKLEQAFFIKEIEIQQTVKELLDGDPVTLFDKTWTFNDVYEQATDADDFTVITKKMASCASNPNELNKALDQYRTLLVNSAYDLAHIIHGEK